MTDPTRPNVMPGDTRAWWGFAALAGFGLFAILWLLADWGFLLALLVGVIVAALLGWVLTAFVGPRIAGGVVPAEGGTIGASTGRAPTVDRPGPKPAPPAGAGSTGIAPAPAAPSGGPAAQGAPAAADRSTDDVEADAAASGSAIWERDEGQSGERASDAAAAFEAEGKAAPSTDRDVDAGADRDDVEADAAAPGSGIWERDEGRSGERASDAAAAFEAEDEPDADADMPAPVEDGTKPDLLDAARDGSPDDLKRIRGVGPKLEEMLNRLGVYHFDQIATWSPSEVAWVDGHLEGFRGRVSRDDWVVQARDLASGKETDFSRKVDDGDVY